MKVRLKWSVLHQPDKGNTAIVYLRHLVFYTKRRQLLPHKSITRSQVTTYFSADHRSLLVVTVCCSFDLSSLIYIKRITQTANMYFSVFRNGLWIGWLLCPIAGFVVQPSCFPLVTPPLLFLNGSVRQIEDNRKQASFFVLFMTPPPAGDEDMPDNEEGADLAAELFKFAQQKGIDVGADELVEEDEEDEYDDDEDEDEEINIPQGAINAFLGYDTGDVGEKLAGNVSLTDDQLYSEMKDRVLDTAGGFVELVGGAREEEDDDLGFGEDRQRPYSPPETVPDSELTAGEVVIQVLDAILHNDVPTPNKGVEIFFCYSSPGSQVMTERGLTPSEYADFLKETEYKVLFDHKGVTIDKADYSFDGKKAFFTARLQVGDGPLDTVSVNFILSTTGVDDDACWLIDSMLIRPQSMRRRRRR